MAAILALGIFIISRLEDARMDGKLFGPPPLRILTENSPDKSVLCEVTGTVLSVRVSGEKASLTVRCGKEAGKLLVSVENNEALPVPGSMILMTGRTELFDTALNPGGFSYRDYYDCTGIWLRFRLDSYTVISEGSSILGWIYRFRQKLSDKITDYADADDCGILKAMLLSDNSEQDREEREDFSFLGLLQTVSLSGLHLVFTGSLIFDYLRKKTGRKLPSFSAGLSVIFLLAVFTGFSMSALRAVIIYCTRAGAVYLKRHFDFATAGALALILIMLESPLRIYTSGFHFMAVILLSVGILNERILRFLRIRGGFYRSLFTALSVQMLILPVRLYHSYAWSLLGPFLYALIFPVSGIIFILGALGAVSGLISGIAARFFFGAEHYFIRFLRISVSLGSDANGLTLISGRPSGLRICIYYLLCIFLVLFLGFLLNRRKEVDENEEMRTGSGIRLCFASVFITVIAFGLIFLHADALEKDTAEILMMDCGQGDAFLIRTADGTVILSDAGSTSDDSFYRDQLSETLMYYGIRKIDYMIVSHPDTDHISGIKDLLADGRFDAEYLIFSETLSEDPAFSELFTLSDQRAVKLLPACAGKELRISGGILRFLWPESGGTETGNEASLVFLLEYQGCKALFTGDISSSEELKLLPLAEIDILKTAHHGSQYSSSEAFLDAVSPEIALISCGRNNSYGHPARETLERLQAAGTAVYTTQHKGAVSVMLLKDRILVKQ